jgi:hypothetical protein
MRSFGAAAANPAYIPIVAKMNDHILVSRAPRLRNLHAPENDAAIDERDAKSGEHTENSRMRLQLRRHTVADDS